MVWMWNYIADGWLSTFQSRELLHMYLPNNSLPTVCLGTIVLCHIYHRIRVPVHWQLYTGEMIQLQGCFCPDLIPLKIENGSNWWNWRRFQHLQVVHEEIDWPGGYGKKPKIGPFRVESKQPEIRLCHLFFPIRFDPIGENSLIPLLTKHPPPSLLIQISLELMFTLIKNNSISLLHLLHVFSYLWTILRSVVPTI